MLFNLDFASNTILSCFFSFFLLINLCLLFHAVITHILNLIVELVIPIGIPTKEAKAEKETHPVIVETVEIVEVVEVNVHYNSKLYKLFCASNSLIYFDLFLHLKNSYFVYFFQSKI